MMIFNCDIMYIEQYFSEDFLYVCLDKLKN